MPIDPPNLDDRRFEDLFREAKALIPRYAPEWTDFNETDPGITLLQLNAWLTETLLYRFNQVPERHYLKFLQLLGIERRPAQPARVDVTFKPASLGFSDTVVPRYTQIAAAGAQGSEPLLFELDRSLVVLGAELDRLAVWDGYRHTLKEAPFFAFGARPEIGNALTFGLHSDADFTAQLVELAIYVDDEPDRACACDPSRYPLPGRLVWEFWDPSRARWRALDVIADETRALTISGRVRFRGPGADMSRGPLPDLLDDRYWFRARLAGGSYDRPPRLAGLEINTGRATQAVTIHGEVLGTSDASPEQQYRTAHHPIVVSDDPEVIRVDGRRIEIHSVQLDIIETAGATPMVTTWQEVTDFDSSGPDSLHFVVDHATGTIDLGDGVRGAIPVLGAQVVARRYRYGGGARGRVGPGKVTELMGSIANVDGAENRRSAWGGADEEPLAVTKRRAPRLLRSRNRAVTGEDFELLALQTPFFAIRRAKSLPLVHPDFPGEKVPGAVTVIVVPDADGPAPRPSEATLRAVCVHLDERRLLTTELHVVGPTYRQIDIVAEVVVDRRADLARVKTAAEEQLRGFVHPLDGGRDGDGWPFGGTLFFSEVYRQLLTIDDLLRVEESGLELILDGVPQGDCRDVAIGPTDLFEIGDVEVRPRYEEERR